MLCALTISAQRRRYLNSRVASEGTGREKYVAVGCGEADAVVSPLGLSEDARLVVLHVVDVVGGQTDRRPVVPPRWSPCGRTGAGTRMGPGSRKLGCSSHSTRVPWRIVGNTRIVPKTWSQSYWHLPNLGFLDQRVAVICSASHLRRIGTEVSLRHPQAAVG